MQLGTHLRELWRLRLGVVLSAVLALFVAVSSIDKSACFRQRPGGNSRSRPPPRTSSSTRRSRRWSICAPNTYDFTSLTTRADLLGNVMASAPVREYIARRAGVDLAASRQSRR